MQFVKYSALKLAMSIVTTFTRADMCSNDLLPSLAMDFGWHDPGYIHTTLMTRLLPSQKYSFRYENDNVGQSSLVSFSTPLSSGVNEVQFLAFGDIGKAPMQNALVSPITQYLQLVTDMDDDNVWNVKGRNPVTIHTMSESLEVKEEKDDMAV